MYATEAPVPWTDQEQPSAYVRALLARADRLEAQAVQMRRIAYWIMYGG